MSYRYRRDLIGGSRDDRLARESFPAIDERNRELPRAHLLPSGDHAVARARKVFSDQQIVDLTAVAGNYVMVAMMLAMAEETVPPGKDPPFKDSEK